MRGKTLIVIGMTLALPVSCSAISLLTPEAESVISDPVTKAAMLLIIPAAIIVAGVLIVLAAKSN